MRYCKTDNRKAASEAGSEAVFVCFGEGEVCHEHMGLRLFWKRDDLKKLSRCDSFARRRRCCACAEIKLYYVGKPCTAYSDMRRYFMKNIGKRIKDLRKKNDLTQEKLAE